MFFDLLMFLIACIGLVVFGSLLVRSMIFIASFLQFSEFVVAFVIMAVSTSLPELFVGISSALNKNPSLSFGNVIGANILDLTFIAGISILLSKSVIRVKKIVIKRDSLFMILVAFLPVLLMGFGNQLSRLDGVILITSFVIFNWHVLKHKKEFRHKEQNHFKKYSTLVFPLVFIVGIIGLFFSANYVVEYGTKLAINMGFPNILIGLIFISMGTTLPELAFELRAARSKHIELAFGDIIGSVVTNSLLVLGIASLIYPISVNFLFFLTSAIFMIVICLIFATFMQGTRLSAIHGIALITLYVLFIMIELSLKGVIPTTTVLG
ncbi:sodium:calcium antiporter [Candidatus Woesearchaeota archaeon]|nr:sodium:calcium antiporter [Candidatus Woesearchaeota archaeon]